MDTEIVCSSCGGPAALLCTCSNYHVCRDCAVLHLTQTKQIHTFVPISCNAALAAGAELYPIVNRFDIASDLKAHIKAEYDRIDSLLETTMISLKQLIDKLKASISAEVAKALDSLANKTEIAKQKALEFLNRTTSQLENSLSENLLFESIKKRLTGFKGLEVFTMDYQEEEFQCRLENSISFKIICPSQQLRMLMTSEKRC